MGVLRGTTEAVYCRGYFGGYISEKLSRKEYMALANTEIHRSPPTDKPYRLADSGILYLQIAPATARFRPYAARRLRAGRRTPPESLRPLTGICGEQLPRCCPHRKAAAAIFLALPPLLIAICRSVATGPSLVKAVKTCSWLGLRLQVLNASGDWQSFSPYVLAAAPPLYALDHLHDGHGESQQSCADPEGGSLSALEKSCFAASICSGVSDHRAAAVGSPQAETPTPEERGALFGRLGSTG